MRSTCSPYRWDLPISSTICASTLMWFAAGWRSRAQPPPETCPSYLSEPVGRFGCDLGDQLLQYGVGEGLIGLGRHHECAGAADHMLQVVLLQVGLQRQD